MNLKVKSTLEVIGKLRNHASMPVNCVDLMSRYIIKHKVVANSIFFALICLKVKEQKRKQKYEI